MLYSKYSASLPISILHNLTPSDLSSILAFITTRLFDGLLPDFNHLFCHIIYVFWHKFFTKTINNNI